MEEVKVPTFLLAESKKVEPVQASELEELENLVAAFQKYTAEVADLEGQIAVRKDVLKNLGQVEIPNILNQHGFSELKLKSGKKVVVKEDASVSIPEEKKPLFYDFLKQRNEEDIIKLQVAFAKMAPEKLQDLFDFLNGYDYDYEYEKGVHAATLKKYFKELLGIGEEDRKVGVESGKYKHVEDVSEFANVYTFFNTKIK